MARAAERSIAERRPLILVSCSGGARMGPEEMEVIAAALGRALESGDDAEVASEVRRTVSELCAAFPLV